MATIFFDKDHAQNMLQKLWQDCKNEESCDVVLISGIDEARVPAHRKILAAASEDYFKRMFESEMLESKSKEVKMGTVHGNILRSLVEFCYTGRVEISEDMAIELLKTAHLFCLLNVVTAWSKFLGEHLDPSNCLGLAILAEQHQCNTLLQNAKDYSLEHIVDVCKTDEFLNLNAEQLGELLACDDLCVLAEEDVFRMLMTWIAHDRCEREKYIDTLLKSVRLSLLEQTFLIKQVKPVCTSSESHQLYVYTLEFNFLPGHEEIKPRNKTPFKQSLMCITKKSRNTIDINYYCQQRKKWLQCLNDLECSTDFGAAVMNDNLFIVGGECNGGITNTILCLNLKTMSVNPVAPITIGRARCGVAALKGFLYAMGGYNYRIACGGNVEANAFDSVEKWNPTCNTWSEVASMNVARIGCGVVQFNEKLYVLGGADGYGSSLNSAEYFDPDQNVWKFIASMHIGREHPGVAAANGFLYAAGGSIIEHYDPRIDKWSEICGLEGPDRVFPNRCVTLYNNKVVIYFNGTFKQYNEETNEWLGTMNNAELTRVLAMFVYSGKLLGTEIAGN